MTLRAVAAYRRSASTPSPGYVSWSTTAASKPIFMLSSMGLSVPSGSIAWAPCTACRQRQAEQTT